MLTGVVAEKSEFEMRIGAMSMQNARLVGRTRVRPVAASRALLLADRRFRRGMVETRVFGQLVHSFPLEVESGERHV